MQYNCKLNEVTARKKANQVRETHTKTSQYKTLLIEYSIDHFLTEITGIQSCQTKYCNDPYNFHLRTDTNVLHSSQTRISESADLLIVRKEVEIVVYSLKGGKSPRVDNVAGELLKEGGEETTQSLTALCHRI